MCHQIHSTTWVNCFNRLYKNKTPTYDNQFVKERLAVTLRYLLSGDSQKSLGWAHRIGKALISKITKETTNAIWEVLKEVCLKPPQEVADWKAISKNLKIFGTFHMYRGY